MFETPREFLARTFRDLERLKAALSNPAAIVFASRTVRAAMRARGAR